MGAGLSSPRASVAGAAAGAATVARRRRMQRQPAHGERRRRHRIARARAIGQHHQRRRLAGCRRQERPPALAERGRLADDEHVAFAIGLAARAAEQQRRVGRLGEQLTVDDEARRARGVAPGRAPARAPRAADSRRASAASPARRRSRRATARCAPAHRRARPGITRVQPSHSPSGSGAPSSRAARPGPRRTTSVAAGMPPAPTATSAWLRSARLGDSAASTSAPSLDRAARSRSTVSPLLACAPRRRRRVERSTA